MRSTIILAAALASCQSHGEPAPSAPTPARSLGVRTLEARDPITHQPLPIAIIYPAAPAAVPRTPATTQFGPYPIQAGRDLPIAAGRWPLIVISHGHGGTLWGHHDLAEALARAGYVVAAVEHIGDSWRDQSGSRSDRVLYGRAYQVTATIDRVLAEPSIADQVDPARIGVAGFSMGGYTSLLMIGARPDPTRIAGYCARHPDDAELCGAPPVHELDASKLAPTQDRRVRAAFVMAPLGVMFAPDTLRAIQRPVFLAWASHDRVLLPSENAEPVAHGLTTLTGTRVIEGAGHYVFLAPCPSTLASELPELCVDPPGIDRVQIHATLASDAVRFFAAALAAPPAHEP
jgi:predicted dienelactone hydrolase